MQKADFFVALKKSVDIDDSYDLNFEKIQHDVKKGEFLIYFQSNLLSAKHYLYIEEYVKKTVGSKTKVFVAYRDIGSLDATQLQIHIKELCCGIKQSLTPFVVQTKMYFEGERFHIDFADDFGKEIFLVSGVKEYLRGYFERCFGRDVTIVLGRHNDGVQDGSMLNLAERRLLENTVAAHETPAPKKAVQKKGGCATKRESQAPAKQRDSRQECDGRCGAHQRYRRDDRRGRDSRQRPQCQIVRYQK